MSAELAALCEQAFGHWNAGRAGEAQALFTQVLDHDANHAGALEGLAVMAAFEGDGERARALVEQVLALGSASVQTRLNFADILNRAGALAEARGMAEGLISEAPDLFPAHYLLGQILWAQGEIEAAFDAYSRARLDLAPDLAGYLEYLCQERLADCDWRGYEAQAAFFRGRIRRGEQIWQPMTPILMLDSPQDLLQAARIICRRYPPKPALWSGQRYGHERIRLGYLTAEVYDHPVGNLIAGVLEHHDRSRFELTCFSYGAPASDAVSRRLIPAFDQFHDLSAADDRTVAEVIHRAEIDIVINLNGLTRDARPGILAWRPAPVQVSYLGFPGTMGAGYVDYLIADRQTVPETDFSAYSEKIVWMPHTYQPTDDKAPIGNAGSRTEAGLPDGAFVFMAYHHPNKINPSMFGVWTNILRRVPGAVLWLPEGLPSTRENLRAEAAARGIDPERLIFAPKLEARADHVARHRLADLFLDNLPFNAHSTASDALWAGLPVLTCRGNAFAGRVCAGLLEAAGLPELITHNLEDYEALAVDLACQPGRLADVRARVEQETPKSPLFDTAGYTRKLEAALVQMHAMAQAG